MNTSTLKDNLTHTVQWAASGSKLIYAAIAVGLIVGLILFRIFFKTFAGFVHCIGFSVGNAADPNVPNKPGVGKVSRIKLLLGLILPAGAAYGAYMFLPLWFPTIFQ